MRLRIRIGLGVAAICATVFAARGGGDEQPELKRVMTTTPDNGGVLRMAAITINRDWNPPVTHLTGHVLVEIFNPPRTSHQVTIVRADQADYFEKTGEIVPRGNVRITVGTEH